MILTIDNLAERYHCLPSEILERATTFDLYTVNISAKWQEHQQQKQQGLNPTKRIPSVDEMKAMINRSRRPE
jgi:hypothetical protein